jgi:hypothetical protein
MTLIHWGYRALCAFTTSTLHVSLPLNCWSTAVKTTLDKPFNTCAESEVNINFSVVFTLSVSVLVSFVLRALVIGL